jgi:hypothetical protein
MFQRRLPEGQRIEVMRHPRPQRFGRLPTGALAARRQPELLQHVGVERDDDGRVARAPALLLRKVEVVAVPVAHIAQRLGQMVKVHAVVFRIHLPLLWVGLALERLRAVLAAPARQKADA